MRFQFLVFAALLTIPTLAPQAATPADAAAAETPAQATEPTPATEAGSEAGEADPGSVEKVKNFRLIDQAGKAHELYRNDEAKAVVLYLHGVGCPIVRQSFPALERLRKEYAEKGVVFYLLNANPQDTREDIAADLEEFKVTIPALHDASQSVASGLGCTRTAEVILIDPKQEWKIIYRGAVDDRFDYGSEKPEAEHNWLKDALEAHLNGQAITTAQTKVKGCLIKFETPEQISYSKDIVPILAGKCVTCHTSGGVGPFSMNSHKRVAGWSEMIEETVATKRMPPWHADREVGEFQNDRGLTPQEEATLLAWIRQGAKADEGFEDPLPALAKEASKSAWQLGEPSLTVQLPVVQELPAEGVVDYRYLYVSTNESEDKWIKAIQVMPTNLAVVHHALVFIIYPKEYRHIQPNDQSGLGGYFAAYLPGSPVREHPGGAGQFFPKGSTLVFQMHYNTTGKPETDQTRMGLYFHDTPPENVMLIKAAAETDFSIPPHTADFPISADYDFERPATVWGLSPHMHYRGGRATFAAERPDGTRDTLLNVPFYEFDWQPMYWFDEPYTVEPGARIIVDGGFDNSRYNHKNPDPDDRVEFGEQSFEEMFIGYIGYTVPRNPERYSPKAVTPEEFPGLGVALTSESIVGTKWRMGRRIELIFEKDGVISAAQGALKGTWAWRDNMIDVESSFEDFTLAVVGDELFFNGRPMKRVS